MTLIRTTGPAAEPVTLAEAKAHLRLAHDSEDALIAGLIRAAREMVERDTGAALIDQAWRLALDELPACGTVTIARFPVKQVSAVTFYGQSGAPVVVDPGDYVLDSLSRPARLHVEAGVATPLRAMNGVEIDFIAGFGSAGPDVPDLFKRAILVLVAHWFEFRAAFDADDQPVSVPGGYERLIAGYRTWRL